MTQIGEKIQTLMEKIDLGADPHLHHSSGCSVATSTVKLNFWGKFFDFGRGFCQPRLELAVFSGLAQSGDWDAFSTRVEQPSFRRVLMRVFFNLIYYRLP